MTIKMPFPSAKLSFYLASRYRPLLNKNSFEMAFGQDKFIKYRGNEYKPVVIHFPGSTPSTNNQNASWLNYFIEKMDCLPMESLHTQNNIHIIQINNYSIQNKYANPGEYFLKKAGIIYKALGKKIKPFQWIHSLKILLLFELLEKIPVTKNTQYFLFFDSSDALLTGDTGSLIHALEEYKCKILFGMDTVIYNSYSLQRNLINTPAYIHGYLKKKYRFLNSGIIFGEVEIMKKVLSFLINEYSTDGGFSHTCDQHYYHYARFYFSDDIEVDYKKKYLLNIFHFKSFFEKYQ